MPLILIKCHWFVYFSLFITLAPFIYYCLADLGVNKAELSHGRCSVHTSNFTLDELNCSLSWSKWVKRDCWVRLRQSLTLLSCFTEVRGLTWASVFKYRLLTKCEVKMAGNWSSVFFFGFIKGFITSILKSLVNLAMRLALSGAIYTARSRS